MKGTALNALLGECGEIPLELRRKEILVKYLIKLYYNKNNSATSILQDKKYHNLEIKSKSKYNMLLKKFLSDAGIDLEQNNFVCKCTPWETLDAQVDLDLLNDFSVHKQNPDLLSDTVQTKFRTLSQNYSFLFFVDGSVTKDGKVGAAILSQPVLVSLQFALPNNFKIYYAEAFAILQAIDYIVKHDLQNSCIISDSSKVIMDIMNVNIETSPYPFVISSICNQLKTFTSITITWFPGHFAGNFPSADKLAREAAVLPSPSVPITFTCSEATCMLEEWIVGLWNKEWEEKPSCSYQKLFKLRKKNDCFSDTRRLDTAISRLRLMQTKLNAGKYKIGMHVDGACSSCGVLQDGIHFVMECVETTNLRDELKKLSLKYSINWSFAELLSHQESIKAIAKYIMNNNVEI